MNARFPFRPRLQGEDRGDGAGEGQVEGEGERVKLMTLADRVHSFSPVEARVQVLAQAFL